MKKAVPWIVFVLIALVPTYFIIFNSLNADGLPDFDKQISVDVALPATAPDPTHGIYTYTRNDPEFILLSEVLSYRTDRLDSLPAGVDNAAFYSFSFKNESGVANTCRLYTDPVSFRTYLTSSQGKVFRLATPTLIGDGRELVPTFVRYAIQTPAFESEDFLYGVSDEEGFHPIVEVVSAFQLIDFPPQPAPVELIIKAYTADETQIGVYSDFADVPMGTDHMTVSASFPLSGNLSYYVGYAIKIAN